MISYKLPLDAANHLVSNSPQDLEYFLLRPEGRHWKEMDFRNLFGGLALQRCISFWKFTRIFTERDGALGLASSKLRGDRTVELFPQCPQIEKFVKTKVIEDTLGTQSFICGVADVTTENIETTSTDIASLFRSGNVLPKSGLITISTSTSTDYPLGALENIKKLFKLAMRFRSITYHSQPQWDQDHEPLEAALVGVLNLVHNGIIPLIPLVSINMEVALLSVSPAYAGVLPAIERIEDAGGCNIADWDVGLLM